jgi:DNA polymerase/3'-5' exonuclease PolX
VFNLRKKRKSTKQIMTEVANKNIITEKNIGKCAKETEKIIRIELVGELNKFVDTLGDIHGQIQTIKTNDKNVELLSFKELITGLEQITKKYTLLIEKKFKSYEEQL